METLTLYVLIVVSRQQVPSAEPRHMEEAAGALPPAQGCAGCRQLHRCSVLSETSTTTTALRASAGWNSASAGSVDCRYSHGHTEHKTSSHRALCMYLIAWSPRIFSQPCSSTMDSKPLAETTGCHSEVWWGFFWWGVRGKLQDTVLCCFISNFEESCCLYKPPHHPVIV